MLKERPIGRKERNPRQKLKNARRNEKKLKCKYEHECKGILTI